METVHLASNAALTLAIAKEERWRRVGGNDCLMMYLGKETAHLLLAKYCAITVTDVILR